MANNRKRQMLRTAGADRLRERFTAGAPASAGVAVPSSREARRAAEREARRAARRDAAASAVLSAEEATE